MSVQSYDMRPLTSSDILTRTYRRQLHHIGTPYFVERIGDCFRTCLANLMGLPPEEVPHFYSLIESDQEALEIDIIRIAQKWLANNYGLGLTQHLLLGLNLDRQLFMDWQRDWLTDMLTITLVSAPGGAGHAVLTRNGILEHDPAYPDEQLDMSFYGLLPVFAPDGSTEFGYVAYTVKPMEKEHDRTWTVPAYISRANPREIPAAR